jgi:Flp pilus assembly protein TadD
MILRSGRNDPGAANALHEALRVNPNFAEAHLQLGILAVAQENTKAAIADLEEAVRLAPDLALAHYHLGLAYRKIGNQERARVELDRFRSLKDQDSYRSRVLESLAAVGR